MLDLSGTQKREYGDPQTQFRNICFRQGVCLVFMAARFYKYLGIGSAAFCHDNVIHVLVFNIRVLFWEASLKNFWRAKPDPVRHFFKLFIIFKFNCNLKFYCIFYKMRISGNLRYILYFCLFVFQRLGRAHAQREEAILLTQQHVLECGY